MKIVDKYELAECPAGTPFFVLNNQYYKNGEDYYIDGGSIAEPMRIKIGDTFYSLDDKPMFNGVAYLEINNYDKDGCDQDFTKDTLPKKVELFAVDEDSNDFDDNNRFLVLDSKEFRDVLDDLEEYYLMLKKNEEMENESN